MRSAFPIIAALALAACATAAATPAGPTAAIGGVAAAGPLLIRPLAIIEDSRCPADVTCVWAGRLVLRAAVKGRGAAQIRNLTLGEQVEIDGGQLLLADAQPAKLAASATSALATRFTFRFAAR